jgi:hypothetical protein
MMTVRLTPKIALLTVLLVQAASIFGATLQDYRERLDEAGSYAFELAEIIGEGDEPLEKQTVEDIKALIPDTEKVEWPSGSLETANQWLRVKLGVFENESDEIKRRAIITEIGERLTALAASTRELESATAATRSKDEDKQKLAEILRRQEYQKPEVKEESLFQKWWTEFMKWLSSVWPEPSATPSSTSDFSGLRLVLQVVILALLIALIGFIVWRLAPFVASRFGDRVKKKREDRVILGEHIGADESASDLFTEAELLAREGNLRGAIRKGYIAVLCELGDRKVVRLARHKTNRDYLRDVRKVDGVFQNMTGLTNSFERTWYGLRVAEPADWDEFRNLYQQTITRSGQGS